MRLIDADELKNWIDTQELTPAGGIDINDIERYLYLLPSVDAVSREQYERMIQTVAALTNYDRSQYEKGYYDGVASCKPDTVGINSVLYINRGELLNRIAHECHYDSEHPLESYTKLLQIIQTI